MDPINTIHGELQQARSELAGDEHQCSVLDTAIEALTRGALPSVTGRVWRLRSEHPHTIPALERATHALAEIDDALVTAVDLLRDVEAAWLSASHSQNLPPDLIELDGATIWPARPEGSPHRHYTRTQAVECVLEKLPRVLHVRALQNADVDADVVREIQNKT